MSRGSISRAFNAMAGTLNEPVADQKAVVAGGQATSSDMIDRVRNKVTDIVTALLWTKDCVKREDRF